MRKLRRFRFVCTQQGFGPAAGATVASLRNSSSSAGRDFGHRSFAASVSDDAVSTSSRTTTASLPTHSCRRRLGSLSWAAGTVAVVVPVYRDAALTRACLQSVLSSSSPVVGDVIAIDDASPEEAVRACLDELERAGRLRVLRNAENRGFVASANLGMRAAGDRDVIILNSDTLVAGDWADRIAAHAAQGGVATVRPFRTTRPSAATRDPEPPRRPRWRDRRVPS